MDHSFNVFLAREVVVVEDGVEYFISRSRQVGPSRGNFGNIFKYVPSQLYLFERF